MFYLTTHSTHFIYGYMASDIWLSTILIVKKETRCRHIGYSYRLTARVLLYAPSHRQDNTYHGLCYTSRGALAGTRNSSMGDPGGSQNTNESFHNVIWTRCPKTTFVGRSRLELAVAEATVVYNDGEVGMMPIYNKLGLSCGTFTVNEMKRIDSKRITNAYIPGTSSVSSSLEGHACAGISDAQKDDNSYGAGKF